MPFFSETIMNEVKKHMTNIWPNIAAQKSTFKYMHQHILVSKTIGFTRQVQHWHRIYIAVTTQHERLTSDGTNHYQCKTFLCFVGLNFWFVTKWQSLVYLVCVRYVATLGITVNYICKGLNTLCWISCLALVQ